MAQDELLPTEKIPEIAEPTEPATDSLIPPYAPIPARSPLVKILKLAGIAVAVVLVTGLVFGKRKTANTVVTSPKPSVDVSRYDLDTDGDRIADFIEAKLRYDPNISELDRCFNSKCDAVNTEAIKRIPRNVMILLDSSGSMQQKVGDNTKMESAKVAIREYLQKASSLEMTKVGLIVYGHKGSNSQADKVTSCASAEIVAPLGGLNLDTDDEILAGVQPVGWTPIGLALREAVKSFQPDPKKVEAKKSPEPTPSKVINEVVIISDGVETCDTNPVAAAKELFESKDNVIVHVIGFAVDSTADNKALRDISQAAGGTYATAPTIDELKLAMDLQWDNYVRRAKEDACRVKGYDTFIACRDDALARVKAYVSSELSRPPADLPYEEKLKLDRIRYVFPGYIMGTLDPFLTPSVSATPAASSQ